MSKEVDLDFCEQIGRHGLVGKIEDGLVTVGGPCGAAHRMSMDAADELRAWLESKIASYRNKTSIKKET